MKGKRRKVEERSGVDAVNRTKTVLMPIKVPDCDYCWNPCSQASICEHFDNPGGHPKCGLHLGTLEYEDGGGVKKPAECACLVNKEEKTKPHTLKQDDAFLRGRKTSVTVGHDMTLKVTKALRKKVNKALADFLDSDKDCLTIQFAGEVVPRSIFKAYCNIKTCSNCWDQYVVAVFHGWPDLIGKYVKCFSSNEVSRDVVMRNEILSEHYAWNMDFIPKGYVKRNLETGEVIK